jgi:hypothetical protein
MRGSDFSPTSPAFIQRLATWLLTAVCQAACCFWFTLAVYGEGITRPNGWAAGQLSTSIVAYISGISVVVCLMVVSSMVACCKSHFFHFSMNPFIASALY